MARSCPICRHKDVDKINLACAEGIGTQQIAQDYGVERSSVDWHRKSGHVARDLTRQVLDAQGGPLSEFAAVAIASKLNRVRELDHLYRRVRAEIDGQDVGKLDGKLIAQAVTVLATAAKELGQWTPDGGDAAAATDRLAASIVIHASVAAKALEQKELANTIDVKPLK